METLQRTANRGSISTGYDIDNSLKVEADNSEYAEYAITSTTDRRNFCFSGWVKRTELVNATDGGQLIFGSFTEGNEGVLLRWSRENSNYYDGIQVDIGQGGTNYRSYTSSVYRDTAAWYHIVLAVNTRENTADDRWKLYVNGEQVTSWAQQQFPTADFLTSANLSGSKHSIGAYETGGTVYGKNCGYFADFHFIDADQGNVTFLPTDFGEYDNDSGIWKPKAYAGSYGTNGFYLDFADASDLGDDESGNGNDFTEVNISAADQATDTPTNNFCTMNMLDRTNGNSKNQEGATKVTTDGGSGWCTMMATMGVTRGKWYWEYFKRSDGGSNIFFGIAASDDPYIPYSSAAQYYIGNVAEQTSIGFQVNNNTIANSNNSSAFALLGNEVLRVALDMDNGALYFGKSTSTWASSGDPTSGASKTGASSLWASFDDKIVLPGISIYQGGIAQANFGGYSSNAISSAASDANGYGTFEYAPPTGYYALCTKNLAEFG
jgi:hypothetical protein